MKFKPLVLVFEYGLAPGTHVKRHSAREIKLVLPLKPSSSVKASPFSHSVPKEERCSWFVWREGGKIKLFLEWKRKLGGISTWAELEQQGDKTKINLSVNYTLLDCRITLSWSLREKIVVCLSHWKPNNSSFVSQRGIKGWIPLHWPWLPLFEAFEAWTRSTIWLPFDLQLSLYQASFQLIP